MAYLDDSFLKKNEEEKNKILNQVLDTNDGNNDNPPNDKSKVEITTASELVVNKKNKEEYDNLMEKSKTNLDHYYDKNNIFVKLLLLLLFLFIVIGAAYYISLFLNSR